MIENEVYCGELECKHNRNGTCIFLNKHGMSTIGSGKDKKIVKCAWYDNTKGFLCDDCKYCAERGENKVLKICGKDSQLIPPKRCACTRFRK